MQDRQSNPDSLQQALFSLGAIDLHDDTHYAWCAPVGSQWVVMDARGIELLARAGPTAQCDAYDAVDAATCETAREPIGGKAAIMPVWWLPEERVILKVSWPNGTIRYVNPERPAILSPGKCKVKRISADLDSGEEIAA